VTISTTDRATWQRQFDEFTAGSLPIVETTLRPFAGLRIPVVRVDSTDRPDVRDMVRILKQEREGSQRGGWGVERGGQP
jgi:hypothetical protein